MPIQRHEIPMDELEKIAVLDNEVQAELVDSVLSERNIPHLMRSYHDSALDGIYQAKSGWGHVEAPAVFPRRNTGHNRRHQAAGSVGGLSRKPQWRMRAGGGALSMPRSGLIGGHTYLWLDRGLHPSGCKRAQKRAAPLGAA